MALSLARRMDKLKSSEIREILKVTQQPDIISFAGGLPAPELFPIEELSVCQSRVLKESGAQALQYSTTEGYWPLRERIATRMNKTVGTNITMGNVLITHGSQQVLDLAGKVFLDEGDVVLCESPTYLAALSAFKSYGCSFKEIITDEHGMLMDDLQDALETTPNCKLIYVIPDFQNPTGKTWSIERRQKLAALAAQYNVAVLEDNPYGELRYEGEPLPSVKSFDTHDVVLYAGSFSKILCPGYRLGWVAGEKELIKKFVLAKQGTDLQCNTLCQMVICDFLNNYDMDKHIATIKETYGKRRDCLLASLDAHMPQGVTYVRPKGGLFSWMELPEHMDATAILKKSLEQKVAFVPGESFFPVSGKKNTLRLNFSSMPETRIIDGVQRLAAVIRDAMEG